MRVGCFARCHNTLCAGFRWAKPHDVSDTGTMWSVRWLVLIIMVAACGGPGSQPTKPKRRFNTEAATAGARDLMTEIYGTLRRGNPQGLMPLLEPDVFWLGPGSETPMERTAALVALDEALPDNKVKLASRSLRVQASATGQAAWVHDRIELNGQPLTLTAFLLQRDELWSVAVLVLGKAAGEPPAVKMPRRSRREKPAPLPGFDGSDVGSVLRASAMSGELFAANLSEDGGSLIGPAFAGWKDDDAAERYTAEQTKASTRVRVTQQGRAPDGSLIWLLGEADVTSTKGGAKRERWFVVMGPRRAFPSLRKSNSQWTLLGVQRSPLAVK